MTKTYIEQLEDTLAQKRKDIADARHIKVLKSAAPLLFEIMDTEVSLLLNKMTQDEPLTHEQYLSAHGQVVGVRRIRNLLTKKESGEENALVEAKVIEDQLGELKKDAPK